MKRKLFVILAVLCIFAGCSNEVSVNDAALNYLKLCNAGDSRIDTIDFKKILSYDNGESARNLTNVSERMTEFLEVYYYIEEADDNTIKNGDFLEFELELLDKKGNELLTDEKIRIKLGLAMLDADIESKLANKPMNKIYKFEADEKLKNLYNVPKAETVVIKPKKLYNYIEKSETHKALADDDYTGLDGLCVYLYDTYIDTCDFEINSEIKDTFIKYAIKKCTFTIPYENLRDYSDNVFNEHMKAAESLGIGFEDYADMLSISEDEFYKMCAGSADYEIRKCLVIGALAQRMNIEVSSAELEEYCSKRNIDISDTTLKAYAEYCCLEDATFAKCVNLI